VRIEFTQRMANTVSGDAAANRVNLRRKGVDLLANVFRCKLAAQRFPGKHDIAWPYAHARSRARWGADRNRVAGVQRPSIAQFSIEDSIG